MSLDKIDVGYSPLTGKLYLYRFGKDRSVITEKREVTKEAMALVIDVLMHDSPLGTDAEVKYDGREFVLTVTPKGTAGISKSQLAE